jgi:hypothetical protein
MKRSTTTGYGYYTADHWRERGREVRLRAGEMERADGKQQLLYVAEMYERMAEQAEVRETRRGFLSGRAHK